MRLMLWSAVAVLLLAVVHSSVDAHCCTPMWHCPPPTCCIKYQPKVVTTYRQEWREEKVPVVVPKVVYRQEPYQVKVQVPVPRLFDQQVTTSHYVPIHKIVERDVKRCVMVAVPVFDPCTCCCYMTFRPTYTIEKVRSTIVQPSLQTRVDVVKVSKIVMEDRVLEKVRTVPVMTQEHSWTVRRTCVTVPCQTTVLVPVWVPCCR